MFRIPTYLASSPIHGVGVFTPQPIPAGTVLWEFHPQVDWTIVPEALEQFPEPYRSWLRAYCYLDAQQNVHVLCGDNAKYMNHSDDPNCDDTGVRFTVARRDIGADEELTCDYRAFDAESATVAGGLYTPER